MTNLIFAWLVLYEFWLLLYCSFVDPSLFPAHPALLMAPLVLPLIFLAGAIAGQEAMHDAARAEKIDFRKNSARANRRAPPDTTKKRRRHEQDRARRSTHQRRQKS